METNESERVRQRLFSSRRVNVSVHYEFHAKSQAAAVVVARRLATAVLLSLLLFGWRAVDAHAQSATVPSPVSGSVSNSGSAEFRAHVRPILENYCFDCHGDGAHKGNVAFDALKSDQDILGSPDLWWKALKNLRAGMMPPAKKPRPSPEEQQEITQWIKNAVFRIDPENPDPGRVTVRRLNRVEYRNTIHDLMGIDYDTEVEFPPDDTGYGFDTIGDVLTLPPMLLEKYMIAAQKIVDDAVPAKKPEPKAEAKPKDQDESKSKEKEKAEEKEKKKEEAQVKAYARFFPGEIPAGKKERRAYARKILADFARRAFRRPVDDKTINRLLAMAEDVYDTPGKTVESGIGQAMVAVLASPRFLFREEETESKGNDAGYPLLDEYSLATRLSYFLWSTTPDDELLRLAGEGRLRQNLPAQVERMLKDNRSKRFVANFTGQWLRARDVINVQIQDREVLSRERGVDPEMEKVRRRYRQLGNKADEELTKEDKQERDDIRATFFKRFKVPLRPELDDGLRRAMRQETEDVFGYVVHEDRSLLELVDSDYTFVNERLAHQYGITNVEGDEMRRVTLPPDSPRGGVLTEGTVLVVTSNPTRTSPVKRGLFILDSILGTPPPPPPANIPPLEDAAKGLTNETPSLRETLAAHRANALCASCHNRMDPLGLAMENFDALGMWRGSEFNEPIDAAGTLLTGEKFSNFKELKHILVQKHAEDFYRTLTEKMLTYALGRGLDYYDVETVDQIVSRIEKSNGRASALLSGIVESAPFQKCRQPSSHPTKLATLN
jgi:mono/diheme cytochrome c family protein